MEISYTDTSCRSCPYPGALCFEEDWTIGYWLLAIGRKFPKLTTYNLTRLPQPQPTGPYYIRFD